MKKPVWQRLYNLLVRGFPQSKIVRILRRDKGQVSRMTNMLVDMGFLVCVNPQDRVRFYEATKKKFSGEDAVILSTIKQEGRISTKRRGCFIRCHAISYLCDVERMGVVPWDKTWETDGVTHCLYRYPFEKVGEVGFQWIRGRSSNQLRINLPSMLWSHRDGSPDAFLHGVADRCGVWFMKRFCCDLRGLRQCGRGHFEMPVRDPGLVGLAQRVSVKRGGLVLDSSLGFPEMGSVEGFDVLGELLGLPKRVDDIEKRVERVVESVERLGLAVDRLTRLFDVPYRVDELRDVA